MKSEEVEAPRSKKGLSMSKLLVQAPSSHGLRLSHNPKDSEGLKKMIMDGNSGIDLKLVQRE